MPITGNPRGRAMWRATATTRLYVKARTFATLNQAHAWGLLYPNARIDIERVWVTS